MFLLKALRELKKFIGYRSSIIKLSIDFEEYSYRIARKRGKQSQLSFV